MREAARLWAQVAREVKASPLGEWEVLIPVAATEAHPSVRWVLEGVAAERVELGPRLTRAGKKLETAQKTRTLDCPDAKCLLSNYDKPQVRNLCDHSRNIVLLSIRAEREIFDPLNRQVDKWVPMPHSL